MPRVGIGVCDDHAVIASLRRAATRERDGATDDPGFETRFAAWWDEESQHRTTWVASLDGEPVGFCALVEFRRMPRPGGSSGRWGYLANLYVLPDRRSDGVGQQLLDVALAEARRRGYLRVLLAPSERAVAFYRRAGFVDVADELMVLPLNARTVVFE